MLEVAEGTLFPVIFFDGEREFPMGNIRISPKQVYKTFKNNISQKLHISPNQLSIYLVGHNNRLKNPITSKSNFAQICKERDCFVLTVLKRKRPTPGGVLIVPPPPPPPQFHYLPHNVALLHHHQVLQELATAQQFLNPYPDSNVGFHAAAPMMIMGNPVTKFCEECAVAEKNGEIAGFHHCVKDVVVKEFRPCAMGPIGRVHQ